MSGNKHLTQDKSLILKNKLEKLAINLQGSIESGKLVTREQYIFETIKVINEFYKSLNEPRIETEEINQIRSDDLPDPALYNLLWNEVLDDLTIIFTELENVETLTLANFNYITTEANRLTSRLKSVSSKLGDFVLYSLNPSKDAIFFKDSFNDVSKIDMNSPLLNTKQCEINQTEGIITLPIDKNKDSLVLIKELPIINPNSNGVKGNNQELGTSFNGNISVLLDNNPDTWFEYERVIVGTSDDKQPLILDMTINLGTPNVVNSIRINPNNFGTKTVIKIEDIRTSLDGEVYTSIKDDIPIAGFTSQDEENIFHLAPSTSKFAGQGLYTFTPRKVKYIHFVLKQTEPYAIETSNGTKLRYAIGLRDIDIKSQSYLSEGELISKPFQSITEIRKVLLKTNQNPNQLSELVEVEYSISVDDGASWHRIQPKDLDGPTGIKSIPEILNFNSNDTDSIITPVLANSIRLKIKLIRNDDIFTNNSSTLNKIVEPVSEVHGIPQASPFTINLTGAPVDGTVSVIDPLFGSRGLSDTPYILGHATDKIDNRRYRLPFNKLPRPVKKIDVSGVYHTEPVPASEWIHVAVGGEEWTQATQPLNQYVIDYENLQNYKIYNLDINRGILEFGDGLTNTLGPPADQPISLWFDAERLFPSQTENNHIALLDFFTSNNKSDMTIKRYDSIKTYTEILPRQATILRLTHENIIDSSNIETIFGLGNKKTFINGKEELSLTDDWSIDNEKGIIYLKTPTSNTTDLAVTYTYQPIYVLSENDWDWKSTNVLRDSVSIKDIAWKTIEVKNESLPTTQNISILDLSNMSIAKGTLNLVLKLDNGASDPSDDTNPFKKEVDFINGTEELGGSITQTTEYLLNGLITDANGRILFTLGENISTNASHTTKFSNTSIFVTDISAPGPTVLPTVIGQYFVQRDASEPDYGSVYLKAASGSGTVINDVGSITYYFSSSNFSDNGLYSIDYKLGKIYTQRPMDINGDWNLPVLEANYQFTDYRAEYRIARILKTDNYNVDITNKTVTLKDSEILKYQQIPHSAINNTASFYLVTYDKIVESREGITELKDKFSPVVKDYALRIITKGKI
jgi:hypothetical protein